MGCAHEFKTLIYHIVNLIVCIVHLSYAFLDHMIDIKRINNGILISFSLGCGAKTFCVLFVFLTLDTPFLSIIFTLVLLLLFEK